MLCLRGETYEFKRIKNIIYYKKLISLDKIYCFIW